MPSPRAASGLALSLTLSRGNRLAAFFCRRAPGPASPDGRGGYIKSPTSHCRVAFGCPAPGLGTPPRFAAPSLHVLSTPSSYHYPTRLIKSIGVLFTYRKKKQKKAEVQNTQKKEIKKKGLKKKKAEVIYLVGSRFSKKKVILLKQGSLLSFCNFLTTITIPRSLFLQIETSQISLFGTVLSKKETKKIC